MTRASAARITKAVLPFALALIVLSAGAYLWPLQFVTPIALVAFALAFVGVRRP